MRCLQNKCLYFEGLSNWPKCGKGKSESRGLHVRSQKIRKLWESSTQRDDCVPFLDDFKLEIDGHIHVVTWVIIVGNIQKLTTKLYHMWVDDDDDDDDGGGGDDGDGRGMMLWNKEGRCFWIIFKIWDFWRARCRFLAKQSHRVTPFRSWLCWWWTSWKVPGWAFWKCHERRESFWWGLYEIIWESVDFCWAAKESEYNYHKRWDVGLTCDLSKRQCLFHYCLAFIWIFAPQNHFENGINEAGQEKNHQTSSAAPGFTVFPGILWPSLGSIIFQTVPSDAGWIKVNIPLSQYGEWMDGCDLLWSLLEFVRNRHVRVDWFGGVWTIVLNGLEMTIYLLYFFLVVGRKKNHRNWRTIKYHHLAT